MASSKVEGRCVGVDVGVGGMGKRRKKEEKKERREKPFITKL